MSYKLRHLKIFNRTVQFHVQQLSKNEEEMYRTAKPLLRAYTQGGWASSIRGQVQVHFCHCIPVILHNCAILNPTETLILLTRYLYTLCTSVELYCLCWCSIQEGNKRQYFKWRYNTDNREKGDSYRKGRAHFPVKLILINFHEREILTVN